MLKTGWSVFISSWVLLGLCACGGPDKASDESDSENPGTIESPLPEPTITVPPSPSPTLVPTPSITPNPTASPTIQPSPLPSETPIPRNGNLLGNGSFEEGINHWTITLNDSMESHANIAIETAETHVAEGAQSLRIDFNNAAGAPDSITLSNTSFQKTDKREYLVRFWAKSQDDMTDIIVRAGNANSHDEVRFRLRPWYHLYHLPFDYSQDKLELSFHFEDASRYYIDGIEILDQSNGVIDVKNTLVWNEHHADAWGWTAADNDISVDLPDGRTLWLFNDSFYGTNHPDDNVFDGNGARFLRNAMVVHEKDNMLYSHYSGTQENTTRYFESIEASPNENDNFYWLGEAIFNPQLNKIQAYLIDVYDTGDGFAESSDRNYLAEFSYPELEFLGIQRQAQHALNYEDFFIDGDYLYLFTHKNPEQWVYHTYVARCDVDDLQGDKGSWRFYNGQDWVEDAEQSAIIGHFTAEGFVKLQSGNYAAVSHPPVSGKLTVAFAERPEGPWTEPQDLYHIPQETNYWSYMSNVHGQLANGSYSVSYSTNAWNEGWETVWADKYWYRQRFIQADLLQLSPYTKPFENIAWQKNVVASSTENQHPATFAVDGDPTTRWSSEYSDTQWLTVDLQTPHLIEGFKIEWESAMAKDYVIEISNDKDHWTILKTVLHNSELTNVYSGFEKTARYVRMRGTQRASIWGYSLFEFKIYGTQLNAQLPAPHYNAARL
ncbi:hypothetical protein TDB9533_03758 [Thalassocella blandensis]|nr:hypothetical protein TDB9533_03758 [Thalassocella blandensis]